MIEKETFCGAVEVWGIARLCNIPLSVFSFKRDRTSVQMVSFNFSCDSLTNHVLYVGHVFHETHKFFSLRKGKILFEESLSLKIKQMMILLYFNLLFTQF